MVHAVVELQLRWERGKLHVIDVKRERVCSIRKRVAVGLFDSQASDPLREKSFCPIAHRAVLMSPSIQRQGSSSKQRSWDESTPFWLIFEVLSLSDLLYVLRHFLLFLVFFIRRETRRWWLMYNRPKKSSTLTECGSVPSLPPPPDEFAPRSVDRVRVAFYRRCWDAPIYNSPPPHDRDSLVALSDVTAYIATRGWTLDRCGWITLSTPSILMLLLHLQFISLPRWLLFLLFLQWESGGGDVCRCDWLRLCEWAAPSFSLGFTKKPLVRLSFHLVFPLFSSFSVVFGSSTSLALAQFSLVRSPIHTRPCAFLPFCIIVSYIVAGYFTDYPSQLIEFQSVVDSQIWGTRVSSSDFTSPVSS